MNNEILTVQHVLGQPGDRYVKCPHCARHVYLSSGPVRGEQFQHSLNFGRGCGGWFEVATDAHFSNAE